MAIYDTTGQVGITKAYKQYFKQMKEEEAAGKGKVASRKMGFAASKGVKEFTDFMSPSKLMEGGKSIFQPQVPKGNLFERIGQKLTGPDLSKVKLTEEAIAEGYGIREKVAHHPLLPKHGKLAKTINPMELTKGTVVDVTEEAIAKGAKPGTKIVDPKVLSRQHVLDKGLVKGGGGTAIGSLLGAYQAGSGLATAFDPKSSGTRKVAGISNVVLGANALLALGGANIWNPMGWGALTAGAGATIADMFGQDW